MRWGDGWWLVALRVQLGKNSWHWKPTGRKPWRNCILDRVAYIIFIYIPHIVSGNWLCCQRENLLLHADGIYNMRSVASRSPRFWATEMNSCQVHRRQLSTRRHLEQVKRELSSWSPQCRGKNDCDLWEMMWESSVKSLLGVMDLIMSYCAPLQPKASLFLQLLRW